MNSLHQSKRPYLHGFDKKKFPTLPYNLSGAAEGKTRKLRKSDF
jgi:hypothetical protein